MELRPNFERLIRDLISHCDFSPRVVSPYHILSFKKGYCKLDGHYNIRNARQPRSYNEHSYDKKKSLKRRCRELGGEWIPTKKYIIKREKPATHFVNTVDSTCSICMEEYGEKRQPWKCDECPHYFCNTCFVRLMKQACSEDKDYFSCPLCRGPCDAPLLVKKK